MLEIQASVRMPDRSLREVRISQAAYADMEAS